MERGVYAQGWFARGYNYHPSLPPRRLKMAEDFAEYRATIMTWPSLGGGPISLAYLEDEAYAPIPARYRQYGFLKDSEFLDEVRARGVKAFSVIFSTQGWEFPVELNEDESEILAMNELRGVGKRGWLGLREFTQNRYPKLWAPFEKYFPDGLTNSRGERVTDLFEECCSRDIHGNPHHADWLEVPAREHICYFMDINNPVWREYLKAIVRIHIDAGVDGIQFDEPDSPLTALRYGGSFSHDNVSGFREYLKSVDRAALPEDVRGSLDDFDYGRWLLSQGREGVDLVDPDALAGHYFDFMWLTVSRNFRELSDYVREYAASVGRSVLVSANLYDGAPWNDVAAGAVDILVPEHRHTLYTQPGWWRYIAAFGGGKPVVVSVNPYGGVIPDLVSDLRRGRSMDRYRVMKYEAAAMGADLAVPYGAWMGAKIEDAMWAPHEETVEIQNFLAENEHLYSAVTANEVAVVASMPSNFRRQASNGALQAQIDPVTGRRRQGTDRGTSLFPLLESLASAGVALDVVCFHDGVLREDDADPAALARYRTVILPDCTALTARQARAVRVHIEGGGRVVAHGAVGVPTDEHLERFLQEDRRIVRTGSIDSDRFVDEPQTVVSIAGAAVSLHVVVGGVAVHIVNHVHDPSTGDSVSMREVEVRVRAGMTAPLAQVVIPEVAGQVEIDVDRDGEYSVFRVPQIRTYAIVMLRERPAG